MLFCYFRKDIFDPGELVCDFYRPRMTGGYVFTGFCLLALGGGVYPSLWSQVPAQPLVPGPFWGYPSLYFQVPSQPLVPGPFLGGGYLNPVTGHAGEGVPSPVTGPAWGISQDGALLDQDWGKPPPPPSQDWCTPFQDRLRHGRYASSDFPQEDFLVLFFF